MKLIKSLLVGCCVALAVVACTNIPPMRTFDQSPLPAPVKETTTFDSMLAPTASAGACRDLSELPQWVGQEGCIEAVVLTTENWANDFVMFMQQKPEPFYVIVRNTFYLGVEGSCLRVDGKLERDDEGRLFIRADNPGQVAPCGG